LSESKFQFRNRNSNYEIEIRIKISISKLNSKQNRNSDFYIEIWTKLGEISSGFWFRRKKRIETEKEIPISTFKSKSTFRQIKHRNFEKNMIKFCRKFDSVASKKKNYFRRNTNLIALLTADKQKRILDPVLKGSDFQFT
jgi:hypothetical protein